MKTKYQVKNIFLNYQLYNDSVISITFVIKKENLKALLG